MHVCTHVSTSHPNKHPKTKFARGATTAPALVTFLKAQAAKDAKGPTLEEMVELAAGLVPDGNKRALLLSSYRSVAGCVYGHVHRR